MSELALEELLSPEWMAHLKDIIEKQPNKLKYLGKNRQWTIPERTKTFQALRGRAPNEWKVVVIGQDPYPRETSAVGVAFNDGEIKKWTDKLNPSFTNIMKAVMMSVEKLPPKSDIGAFRKAAASSNLVSPPEWFEHTQKEGVLWLNTALTFSSKEIPILKLHTEFWKPIITAIFDALIKEKKKEMADKKQGLVFIMWGGYAQKFRGIIEELNAKSQPPLPIAFVDNCHPAATGASLDAFFTNNSFNQTNKELESFGLEPVQWFAASSGQPHEAVEEKSKSKRKNAGDGEESNGKRKKK